MHANVAKPRARAPGFRDLDVFRDLLLLAAAQKHDGGQRGRAKADAADGNAEHEPRERDGAVAGRDPVHFAGLVDGLGARAAWEQERGTHRKTQQD